MKFTTLFHFKSHGAQYNERNRVKIIQKERKVFPLLQHKNGFRGRLKISLIHLYAGILRNPCALPSLNTEDIEWQLIHSFSCIKIFQTGFHA